MIAGWIEVTESAVETHRDSYLLAHLTVASARRPFQAPGLLFAGGFGGFAVSFADLLYLHEMILLACAAAVCLIFGRCIGQLQLLSRDLRGTELRTAVYGTYGHLNRIRREIAAAITTERGENRA